MTFLCSPVWDTPATFRLQRGYVDWYVLGWTPSIIITMGRDNIFEETVFGGFRTHLKFKSKFWDWSSGTFEFQDIFEDFYVTFPGSATPANAGVTHFSVRVGHPYFRDAVIVDPAGFPFTQYRFMDLPESDPDYWQQNGTPAPARPFAIPP